jgi:integrase
MAYYRKTKTGWRAEVVRDGVRTSAVRKTKAEAQAWAVAEEAAILAGQRGLLPAYTFKQAIDKYRKEVINKKPKERSRADNLRLDFLEREFPELVAKVFHEIRGEDLAAWRDKRLETVTADTMMREVNLYRPIWTLAIKEWRWVKESPWKQMRLPKKGKARKRRGMWQEIRRIWRSACMNLKVAPVTAMQQTAWASRVALHTSLRSQEILGMARDNVDLKRRIYHLKDHKTRDHVGERIVPLPSRCIQMLAILEQAAAAAGRNEYFTISDSSRDALYRKLRDRVMVEGLRFHDLRATALTLLSKRVDVMTLARISGHKNINELFNTYYRETEEEIAARI